MSEMKTPGIYIVDKNAFPNSVVEVATSVPAFVGYTQRAEFNGRRLHGLPHRIGSMAEFETCFGGAPPARFGLTAGPSGAPEVGTRSIQVQLNGHRCRLYHGMSLFFANGGGACWVVSVGGFDAAPSRAALTTGIDALRTEQEPSLLVVPDAVSLPFADCIGVQQAMLQHCSGDGLCQRFAILDVPDGDRPLGGAADPVQRFRQQIGTAAGRSHGAAYYPYLDTTVVPEREVDIRNLDGAAQSALVALLRADPAARGVIEALPARRAGAGSGDADLAARDDLDGLHAALLLVSPIYKALIGDMRRELNRLAPSAALAGICAMVDQSRGVWKAPANVSVACVVRPAMTISHEQQEDLNVTTSGLSINALRSFSGEGVLVWGARTLDGNSLDWRYINVRRTLIMLKQSCRLATQAFLFEPNVAATSVSVKAMLVDFLTRIWKRGGLAGALPEDAFSVHCGLGETMTAEDIRDGILRVTALVAVTRPAEFIEINFQQQMMPAAAGA